MILVDFKREGKKVNMNGCLEVIILGFKVEGMRFYFILYIVDLERINWWK